METNSHPSILSKYLILSLCMFMVLLMIVLYMQGRWYINRGELADPDCYTRLNRVIQLHETGKWYDAVLAKSNAPYGENLHWTRPFDLLLVAGASIFTPVAGFDKSLFWWGVLISPCLLIASLMIIPWAFRPLLSYYDANLMRLVFIFQHGVTGYYTVGRPDYNSLMGFAFILVLGLVLRMVQNPFNKKNCWIAGMVTALYLWIGVEALLLILLSLAALGIFWIFNDGDFENKSVHYSLSLFIFTGAALLLERPLSDLMSVEYDKISIVHFFILGLVSLYCILVIHFKRHTALFEKRTQRFGIALLGFPIIAFCVWLIFPGFFRGGLADIDPRIVPFWLNTIVEMQSSLSLNYFEPMFQLVGTTVVGMMYIIFLLRKESDKNVNGWIFIMAGVLFFASAVIMSRRLLLYGNIMASVPFAAFLGAAVRWEKKHVKSYLRKFIVFLTIIFVCIGFRFLGSIINDVLNKYHAAEQQKTESVRSGEQNIKEIPLSSLCDELNMLKKSDSHNPRILAHIFYGPEIVYRTGFEVIGTPHHRNAQGMLDTYWIMSASSDEKAHDLISQRGINMILLNNDPNERMYYSRAPEGTIFYDHLKDGNYPDWIKPVELPPILSIQYKLFRING